MNPRPVAKNQAISHQSRRIFDLFGQVFFNAFAAAFGLSPRQTNLQDDHDAAEWTDTYRREQR